MLLKSSELCSEEVRSGFCPQNGKLLPKEEPSHTISSTDREAGTTHCGQWGGRDSNPHGVLLQRILSLLYPSVSATARYCMPSRQCY